jgi:hypothetical protein
MSRMFHGLWSVLGLALLCASSSAALAQTPSSELQAIRDKAA